MTIKTTPLFLDLYRTVPLGVGPTKPRVVMDRHVGFLPAAHGPALGFVPAGLEAALAYGDQLLPHLPGSVSCYDTDHQVAEVVVVGKDPLVLA